MSFSGRYLVPVTDGDNVRDQLNSAPVETQRLKLFAAN